MEYLHVKSKAVRVKGSELNRDLMKKGDLIKRRVSKKRVIEKRVARSTMRTYKKKKYHVKIALFNY